MCCMGFAFSKILYYIDYDCLTHNFQYVAVILLSDLSDSMALPWTKKKMACHVLPGLTVENTLIMNILNSLPDLEQVSFSLLIIWRQHAG